MSLLARIAVFCGSAHGHRPIYAEAAAELGRMMAARRLGLVYGGGNVGLMGVVADAVLAGGGEVDGVIPEAMMAWEVGHPGLTRLHVVGSMHQRKAMMAELADAFIALPGGIGTMDETFEIWTWAQLGMHAKPLGFLDVGGFYATLHQFLDHMSAEGFLKPRHRAMVAVESDAATLLDGFAAYRPPEGIRVIDGTTA